MEGIGGATGVRSNDRASAFGGVCDRAVAQRASTSVAVIAICFMFYLAQSKKIPNVDDLNPWNICRWQGVQALFADHLLQDLHALRGGRLRRRVNRDGCIRMN